MLVIHYSFPLYGGMQSLLILHIYRIMRNPEQRHIVVTLSGPKVVMQLDQDNTVTKHSVCSASTCYCTLTNFPITYSCVIALVLCVRET